MATYKARVSWLGKNRPMDYVEKGDKLIIRGKTMTVKDLFVWDGKLVYDTDHGLLYADELVREE